MKLLTLTEIKISPSYLTECENAAALRKWSTITKAAMASTIGTALGTTQGS